MTAPSSDLRHAAALALALGALLLATVTCGAPDARHARGAADAGPAGGEAAAGGEASHAAAVAGWDVVYEVLQHPRCANCHPAGNAPLQGDAMRPHAQLVQRGPGGHGVFGMRCDTCHQDTNLDGPFLPPGVRNWHMPRPDMPLVFVGVGSRDLCEQLRDPARNGGKTPAQLLEHMESDPLVLWGWDPGNGRAPVSVPHDRLAAAMRAWVENDCGCPER
jgi:hypothetical protein